jgi:hypothetical protein
MTKRGGIAALTVALPVVLALAMTSPAAAYSTAEVIYVGHAKLASHALLDSLAIDRAGGVHVIGADGEFNRATYATKQSGASDFTYRAITGPGRHPREGLERVLVAPTVDGRAIDAVLSKCGRVLAVHVPVSAPRLAFHKHDQVTPEARCGNDGEGEDRPPDLLGFVAMPHQRIALLFFDEPAAKVTTYHAPTVLIGRPGHHFRVTRLPHGAVDQGPLVITRDASDGRVIVAGLGDVEQSGNQPIDVWTLGSSHSRWRGPVRAADLPPAPDNNDQPYTLTSIAASHHEVWVGYTYLPHHLTGAQTGFVLHRSATGRWARPSRVPVARSVGTVGLVAGHGKSGDVWELDDPATASRADLEVRAVHGARLGSPRRLARRSTRSGLSFAATPDWHGGYRYGYGFYPSPVR